MMFSGGMDSFNLVVPHTCTQKDKDMVSVVIQSQVQKHSGIYLQFMDIYTLILMKLIVYFCDFIHIFTAFQV